MEYLRVSARVVVSTQVFGKHVKKKGFHISRKKQNALEERLIDLPWWRPKSWICGGRVICPSTLACTSRLHRLHCRSEFDD